MRTEEFTVPAGWYPDPLGLPQLRWWDNHAWTEHVAEARHPLVVQDPLTTPITPAPEPVLPETRRERREREERERRDGEDRRRRALGPLELDASPADTGRETTAVADTAQVSPTQTDSARPEQAEPHHEAGGLRAESAQPASVPAALSSTPVAPAAVAWAIALMPLLQLLASLLLVGTGTTGVSASLAAAIWLVPAPAVVGLAVADSRLLGRSGVAAASWGWALLGAPVYLLARAIRLRGGFGPVVAWAGLALGLVASVLLVPGIVVAALPHVFAAEAEAAIADDASVMGAQLAVDCPAPPTIVGQEFVCSAEDPRGEDLAIRVALDRSNGWISWHVADWGVFTLFR